MYRAQLRYAYFPFVNMAHQPSLIEGYLTPALRDPHLLSPSAEECQAHVGRRPQQGWRQVGVFKRHAAARPLGVRGAFRINAVMIYVALS